MDDSNRGEILVAYDGSDSSRRAVEFAAERAGKTGEAVDIVYVGGDRTATQLREAIGDEFLRERIVANFETIQMNATGNEAIARRLAEYIRDHEYTLLVMGNSERGRLYNAVRGSVTGELIEQRPLPILLVPAATEG
ncbi:MAG: universal stress protein UspA related nucleotide-binding protein [uncultured archaeon A07HR60]|nr:MAG: universal stress protein UspA related nucleotide-binding protein [Halorubrum sp. J07HR59]ESS12387.1 MAG: universal stress protein UspA related nucleotide-binding protein [uncultured archaeon A07HR60]